ncbi:hypothetical protein [Nocardia sp. NPDC052316]|uniref:hypothetical protein n=1 Tax=Nocardia sp. NPDC052316 TaxID=3364329 RepID=UPI0037C5AB51
MTRSVLLATAAATLAVALTACGGEGASDAAPSASSTVSTSARAAASGTVAPTAETTAPAAETTSPAAGKPEPTTSATPQTTAAPATAKPCAVVTREYLITTLRMTASPKYPLADLQNARCSGNYATALSQPEGTLHPVVYMFKYAEPAGWRLMGVDDAIDCVNRHGVPLEDARVIGCAL